MRKILITASAALFTLAATAQQPLQCLNPDVLNGLVFLGRSEAKMEITRELPVFMQGFAAPSGFTLIGSGVRQGRDMTIVAYKTSLATDRAFTAIVTAFGTDGWAIEASPGSATTFNVAGAPRSGTICRNGERRSVLVTQVSGTSYVDIVTYPDARARDCNAPDPAMDPGASFMAMRNRAPNFQFPAGTTLAMGSGGGGGSNDNYTTSSRVISAATASALVEHLGRQMESQGWRPDANWSGTGSSGSTWRKSFDGQLSWGTLEISGVSEGTYDVDFTITMAPQ